VQSRTVVVGTINIPPHAIEDPSLPSFSRELITEALRTQGWEVRFEFYPWARAFQAGKEGLVDAVWPSIWRKEREEWFEFGKKVLNIRYVLLKRSDLDLDYRGLDSAKPYLIGVLRGGITGSALDGSTDFRTEEVASFDQNIQKMAAGRIDFMTCEHDNGMFLLQNKYPELSKNVTPIKQPISTAGYWLMFSKKAPDSKAKREAFDKGLMVLISTGRYQALLKKYSYDADAGVVD
jgi:polar amino acid transport system substrate-binding protein